MNKIIKTYNALADETRMRIFLLLLNGSLCVCELISILDMKQARISRILKKLTDAGLTESKREGKWIIYSVNPDVLKYSTIKGLLDDIKISVSDLKKLKQCKDACIRESCVK